MLTRFQRKANRWRVHSCSPTWFTDGYTWTPTEYDVFFLVLWVVRHSATAFEVQVRVYIEFQWRRSAAFSLNGGRNSVLAGQFCLLFQKRTESARHPTYPEGPCAFSIHRSLQRCHACPAKLQADSGHLRFEGRVAIREAVLE